MVWNPLSKTRIVPCPGNREIRVFKDPRNAFPLYTKAWTTQLKVATDAATQLRGEVGGAFATRMDGLLIRLDDANGAMQLELSALYEYYSGDPCTREDWFRRQLERTLDKVTFLQRAKVELDALRLLTNQGETQGELIKYVTQMMDRLKVSDDELSRRRAFDNASKAVGAWQKKEHADGR